MALSLGQVRVLYNKRAKYYDISGNLYYLIGFREGAYRKKAVGALGLRPGDTVVDMCCGTGLNFRSGCDALEPGRPVVSARFPDAGRVACTARADINKTHQPVWGDGGP